MELTVSRSRSFECTSWRKSSRCSSGTCVEVSFAEGKVAVSDSKNLPGPVLVFTESEWQAFLEGVRHGEFDLPEASGAEPPS
jgi:predicted secreted Zn-dependent protease